MYEIGIRRVPPLIDLLDTPASRILSRRSNRRFMKFMRSRFGSFSHVNRICIFVMWVTTANISRIITPIMSIGCFPVLVFSMMLMSSQLLEHLLVQHEFWFFTITNALNWIMAAILFNDGRIVGCITCFLITQLVILMDANFRTVISATRSFVLWIPAIASIIFICATRSADIDPQRFHVLIPKNKIDYTLVNSFLNNNMTLMIFVIRKTFRRRRILTPEFLESRIIPCSVLRCDLVLQRMRANDRASQARYETFKSTRAGDGGDNEFELHVAYAENGESRVFATIASVRSSRHGSVSVSGRRASALSTEKQGPMRGGPKILPSDHSSQRHLDPSACVHNKSTTGLCGNKQRLRVVTPTLTFLDARNTLLSMWAPSTPIRAWISILHMTLGSIGLLLGGFTMYLPMDEDGNQDTAWHPRILHVLVPTVSFFATTAFFVPYLGSCQRNLFRALTRNFDFMFSSVQFSLGCICLADMLRWDFRCFALLSRLQWFHWILIWDALLPSIRENFHFRKRHDTPVLGGIMMGLVWVVYSLFFSSNNALKDRTLAEIEWGTFKISIRTSTFLVGRLNTILTWSIRLIWKAIQSEEDELIFIRGSFEYFTPMEIYPVQSGQTLPPFDQDPGTTASNRSASSAASAHAITEIDPSSPP